MTGENGTPPPVRQLRLVVKTEDYDDQVEADGQASAKLRIAFEVDDSVTGPARIVSYELAAPGDAGKAR